MTLWALLLSALLCVLTIYGEKKGTARIGRINRILGLAGATLVLLSAGVCVFLLSGSLPDTARVSLAGYGLTAGGVFAATALILGVSLLLRRAGGKTGGKKDGLRTVRILASLLGSCACLLLTALWTALTRGGVPDLSPAYLLCGTGLALTLRLTLPPDYPL